MKKTMLQSTTLLAATVLLTACASSGQDESGAEASGVQNASTGAKLAVFQKMFEQGGTGADTATRCVGTGSAPDLEDTSQSLLTALKQNASAPVVAASNCSAGERASFNGQPAVFYGVDMTECSADGACMARGSYYSGNVGAQSNLYRVEQVNGEWQATLAKLGPAS